MTSTVVITGTGTTTIDAVLDDGHVRAHPSVLDTVFGWHLEAQGEGTRGTMKQAGHHRQA